MFLLRNAAKGLFAYALLCAIMWGIQRDLMYHPSRDILPPSSYNLTGFDDTTLIDTDGTHVHIWRHEAQAGYPTILFFHGNAGNLSHRAEFLAALTNAGFGVIALDYRGFGQSEGNPTEQGMYQDARAVMQYATRDLQLSKDRLIIYGESIGTGVAVQLALESPAAALVLQSPFTSLEDAAISRYWWLPVHYLISDHFDSVAKISHIHLPLLILHGDHDGVVPVEEGKQLFASANQPKQMILFPGLGHNDLGVKSRLTALREFCTKHGLLAR